MSKGHSLFIKFEFLYHFYQKRETYKANIFILRKPLDIYYVA